MDNKLIKTMEQMYPECTDALMNNFDDAYNLWCRKQSDYGDGNIRLGLTLEDSSSPSTRANSLLAQLGIVIRMNDKIQRMINLHKKMLFNAQQGTTIDSPNVKESIEDTCIDIMNYANMLMVLRANKWGR